MHVSLFIRRKWQTNSHLPVEPNIRDVLSQGGGAVSDVREVEKEIWNWLCDREQSLIWKAKRMTS